MNPVNSINTTTNIILTELFISIVIKSPYEINSYTETKVFYNYEEKMKNDSQNTNFSNLFTIPASKMAKTISRMQIAIAFFHPYSFQRTEIVATQGI